MNLLMLLQGTQPADQPGYHQTMLELEAQGVLNSYSCIPYLPSGPDAVAHWDRLYSQVLRAVADQGIDILMLQWFHGPHGDPRPMVAAARKINPRLLVVTTCGDGYGRWFQRPPRSLFQAASVSDLCFLTSMGHMADRLLAHGARNVVLMPHGACQTRFSAPVARSGAPDFEVVFIGSNNAGRNPFTPLSRSGRLRREMVRRLTLRYGKRFGLFGLKWEGQPSWQGPTAYAEQHQVAARSRIQLGGFPGAMAPYYTSDRFFIALASGIPLLDFAVPRVDRLAEVGTHWLPYDSMRSLLAQVDRTLELGPEELDGWGQRARDYILRAHTQAHRTREMVGIIQDLLQARMEGRTLPPPRLRCFAESASPELETRWALRGWRG